MTSDYYAEATRGSIAEFYRRVRKRRWPKPVDPKPKNPSLFDEEVKSK